MIETSKSEQSMDNQVQGDNKQKMFSMPNDFSYVVHTPNL